MTAGRALALALTLAVAGPAAGQTATLADKYLWLEDQHAPTALAWARVRREAAVHELSGSPVFPAVERELRESLTSAAPLPNLFLLGDHFVRLVRDTDHPAGLLQTAPKRADHRPGAWRTVLDVVALNAREGTAYALDGPGMFDFPNRCLPPAFDRCLLALSSGGSSSLELREFDLGKGDFVEGGFHLPANRAFAAWLNADSLIVAHSLLGSPALPSNFPAVVRLWKRGTPLAAAKPVFQASPTSSLVEINGIGVGPERKVVLTAVLDYSTIDYHLIDQAGAISQVGLPEKVKYVGRAARTWPYLAVQLAAPATLAGKRYAAEAIVAYDVRPATPTARRFSQVFAPQVGTYVSDGENGLDGAGESVVFVQDSSLRKTLLTATPGPRGWSIARTLSAPAGVKLVIVKTDESSRDVLVEQEGFLIPPAVSLLAPHAAPVTVEAGRPILDASRFVVDIRSAPSKDGTLVDYYLVRPRQAKPGPVPTLIEGYGMFGVDFDPNYFSSSLGRSMASWLSRGGAYAATAIRGGGERGEAWHLGGAALNKQNSFDDFAGVAADLVRSGFTTPAHLGAFGRSGGGLLTAAMVTQHPELFGAIYVGVPVTDVGALATSGSGIIKGQKSELGDWDDPKALQVMLTWSPYQNIRAGVRYPPVLIVTSTEDNQVGPGQARKFAAKLEEAGANPLLIEEPQGGHGVPDQIKQTDIAADQMVFFIDRLMK
jgi:prolyl oligopeptidase